MNILTDKLKKLRLENKLYQKQIADMLNIKQETYSSWERGRTSPDIDSLVKLADIFKCSIDYLVGRESEDFKIITTNETNEAENSLLNTVRKLTLKNQKLLYEFAKFLLMQQENGNL